MRKTKPFSEQLRQAVRSSEKTRYRISQETGIPESTLSRFVNQEFGLAMPTVDLLCNCLGARLTVDAPDEPATPRKKKGR